MCAETSSGNAELVECIAEQKRAFDAVNALADNAMKRRVKHASESEYAQAKAESDAIEFCKQHKDYYGRINWLATQQCLIGKISRIRAGHADESTLISTGAESIRSFCSKEWPSDYRMQEYCMQQQRDGLGRVSSLLASIPSGLTEAYAQCADDWKWGPGRSDYDWRMVAYCMEKQRESYDRLR